MTAVVNLKDRTPKKETSQHLEDVTDQKEHKLEDYKDSLDDITFQTYCAHHGNSAAEGDALIKLD